MTRRAYVETTCPICWADLLVGLDGNVAAFDGIADAAPLTRMGELLAVVAGRLVYEDDAGRLYRRDRWMLRDTVGKVVAEHRCWEPVPAHWIEKTPPRPAPADKEPF